MRVQETIEARGFFWRGEDIQREHRVPGTLRVAESGSIALEVFGVEEFPSTDQPRQSLLWHGRSEPRIVGFVEGHGRVILCQCSPVQYRNYGAKMSSFSSVSYSARSLLVLRGEEIQIDSIVQRLYVNMEGLARWIGKTGYSLVEAAGEEPDPSSAPLGFERLDDMEYDLGDGTKVTFAFWGTSPSLAVIEKPLEMKLKQNVVMGLTRDDGWSIEDAIELVVKSRNLVALLTGEPVEILGVNAEWSSGADGEHHAGLPYGAVYYESTPFHQSGADDAAIGTVVRYEEVGDHLEKMLQDWFTLYDRASQALDIYFAFRYSETVPLIEGFLALTRALEAFHRQTTGVLDAPFRSRLSAIMSSYEGLYPHEGIRDDFVLAVRDARNYWTHFEPGIRDEAGKSAPLWWLLRRLDTVLQMCILDVIMPPHLSAAELVSRNPFLSQDLGLWSEQLARARGYSR